jgi:septin family protein
LNPLDIEVMKRLGSRVNLIPVIAKADTLTPSNLEKFKQNVRGKKKYLYLNAKKNIFTRFVR